MIMAKILEKTKEMVKPVIEFEKAVFEKVRNMVSRVFSGEETITIGVFVHQFSGDLLNLAKTEVMKTMPKWKHGTPPHVGWWLAKTTHDDGHVTITLDPFVDGKWLHEGESNVMYMDMNDLDVLPEE